MLFRRVTRSEIRSGIDVFCWIDPTAPSLLILLTRTPTFPIDFPINISREVRIDPYSYFALWAFNSALSSLGTMTSRDALPTRRPKVSGIRVKNPMIIPDTDIISFCLGEFPPV